MSLYRRLVGWFRGTPVTAEDKRRGHVPPRPLPRPAPRTNYAPPLRNPTHPPGEPIRKVIDAASQPAEGQHPPPRIHKEDS